MCNLQVTSRSARPCVLVILEAYIEHILVQKESRKYHEKISTFSICQTVTCIQKKVKVIFT